VIDATGLRVHGAREWHVQKHGSGRRRTLRKLALGVDERTKEIVATEITTSHVHDSQVLPALLSQVTSEIAQVSGDGAYKRRTVIGRLADAVREPRSQFAEMPDGGNAEIIQNGARSGMKIFVGSNNAGGMSGA